jgi:hypothetical protein
MPWEGRFKTSILTKLEITIGEVTLMSNPSKQLCEGWDVYQTSKETYIGMMLVCCWKFHAFKLSKHLGKTSLKTLTFLAKIEIDVGEGQPWRSTTSKKIRVKVRHILNFKHMYIDAMLVCWESFVLRVTCLWALQKSWESYFKTSIYFVDVEIDIGEDMLTSQPPDWK